MKQQELTAYRETTYLKYSYEEVIAAAKPIFKALIDALIQLPEDAAESDRLWVFERCVEHLNEMDERADLSHGIDTIEREEFCEQLYVIGELVGLDPASEFVDDWREW